jgi:hypothetical protein
MAAILYRRSDASGGAIERVAVVGFPRHTTNVPYAASPTKKRMKVEGIH